MTSALVYKELRETLAIALLGLAALLLITLNGMGYNLVPDVLDLGYYRGGIPFLSDSFSERFTWAAGALALALGFWQSLGDFWGDAQLFLLHRPVSRRQIYATKLAVGLGTYLLCAAVPIILYAGWAATPGTHASPFDWSMTANIWNSWLSMTSLYLGAFLSGIRPAAWVGTRLMPLAAGGLSGFWTWWWTPSVWECWGWLVVVNIVLTVAIFRVAATRDFA